MRYHLWLPAPRGGGLTECEHSNALTGEPGTTLLSELFGRLLQGVFAPRPLRPFTNRTALWAGYAALLLLINAITM